MLDLILLIGVFFGTGLFAILYFRSVPNQAGLRQRLPNRPGLDGIFLTLLLVGIIWYLVRFIPGGPILKGYRFILSLLVFETFFLFFLRWIRSTIFAIIPSLGLALLGFFLSIQFPTNAFLMNALVILASLGPTTLLIRIGFLRSSFLAVVATLWTLYDVLLATILAPKVLVPSSQTQPFILFPAVSVGDLSVGNGDFLFLVLYTLIIFRDFGRWPAILLAGIEAIALLITGLVLPTNADPFPFLLVMTPLFFFAYGTFWIEKKTRGTRLKA
jgi:hypothetical protein